jgi:HEAT repeat protein
MSPIKASKQEPAAHTERRYDRDHAGLIAALSDDTPSVRRWAAMDLAADADAVPELGARLPLETDRAVREAILSTLVGIGGDAVVEALVPHLSSENASLRGAVVEWLSQVPAVTEVMPRLLADPDADVRVLAVMMLATLRDPRVPGWLIGVVSGDPDHNVCGAAIGELAEVGDETACGAIAEAAVRFAQDPFIVFAANATIARLTGGQR